MPYLFLKFQPEKFISWHTPQVPQDSQVSHAPQVPKFPQLPGFEQGWYLYIENSDPDSGNNAAILINWKTEQQATDFITKEPELVDYLNYSGVKGKLDQLHPEFPKEVGDIIRIQLDFNFLKKTVAIQIMSPDTQPTGE